MRYETVPSFAVWTTDSSAVSSQGRVAAMAAAFQAGGRATIPLTPRQLDHNAVDDLIKLYESARTQMAKRNILVQLNGEIASWLRQNPTRITLAWVALQDVVARALKDYNSAAQFTHVICVGWRVGCNYRAATNHISRSSANNPDYFAHSSTDKLDMIQKCADMARAIGSAKTGISVNGVADSAQTLKIFMAPEFYFRGQNGAYSPEIVGEIVPRMKTLLGPGWNDWLFVFGTAIASIEETVTFCSTCGYGVGKIKFERDPADHRKTIPKCSLQPATGPAHVIDVGTFGAEVQNVALVCHAGESYLVAKEYVSGIDYIANKVKVQPGTTNERSLKVLPPQGSHSSRIKSLFDDERLGGCILNMAGLTIGLEVCLDHIASPDPTLGRASKFASIIQVLLIPSYGMEIGTGLYCRTGGVVFNVDGRGTGKTDVVRKGETKPGKINFAAGRGTLDVWRPVHLPA
jgi:hypothetical protein